MTSATPSVADKRAAFHHLHESGCFVIPNPWDVGSARMLQGMGFPALATTSSGLAWSLGRPDNGITLDLALTHLAELVAATDVPVNADFEDGFAVAPDEVATNVHAAVETGVAGLSIEDSTREGDDPLYALDHAVERVRAARRAIDAAGGDTLLVARAEGLLYGRTDLDEIVARLTAYADAGADCLYAPGLRAPADIERIVDAVAPKPLNLLMAWPDGLRVSDYAALGVRRISVGGALARAAWLGFLDAARGLADEGSFEAFGRTAPGSDLDAFFTSDRGPA
ncbi:MAG TPA: isocitrate lyase/phosphoenolpyruvate mutase family protein [Candidatus Nanopelagicales bacterium]|nr:isocitrate lyase/phosphoenolpyruvate mutase family protein [Candidatus Nanopelagicales bacterium]